MLASIFSSSGRSSRASDCRATRMASSRYARASPGLLARVRHAGEHAEQARPVLARRRRVAERLAQDALGVVPLLARGERLGELAREDEHGRHGIVELAAVQLAPRRRRARAAGRSRCPCVAAPRRGARPAPRAATAPRTRCRRASPGAPAPRWARRGAARRPARTARACGPRGCSRRPRAARAGARCARPRSSTVTMPRLVERVERRPAGPRSAAACS